MIRKAIIVLSDTEDGPRFLKVIPDLKAFGLEEAILLHVLPASGPAEPMPELASWVRHFEAALPRVKLALKRGDVQRWIAELARLRSADLVAVSSPPGENIWDFDALASRLRALAVPLLYVPEVGREPSLSTRLLLAIDAKDSLERLSERGFSTFEAKSLEAVHVSKDQVAAERDVVGGVSVETVPCHNDVASTLLEFAEKREATLLALAPDGSDVRAIIEATDRPVLIWPIAI